MGMLNLTVELAGKVVKKYTFGDERKILLGRSSECDVVIDNLGVSRTHCELFWTGHCWVVQDLKSNNGTVVNGKKVPTHNVNPGDEVTISKYKIICEPAQEELEFAVEAPVKIPGYGESTLPIEAKRGDSRAVPKPKGFLLIEAPSRRTITLEKTITVIGSGEAADVKSYGFFIARKHALIVRDDAGFLVVDTSGRQRSLLNETPIDTERLRDGDTIKVGKVALKFQTGSPTY